MGIESHSNADQEIVLDRKNFLKRAKLQKIVMEIFLGEDISQAEKKQTWIERLGPGFDSAFEKRFIANPDLFKDIDVGSPEFAVLANEIAQEIK